MKLLYHDTSPQFMQLYSAVWTIKIVDQHNGVLAATLLLRRTHIMPRYYASKYIILAMAGSMICLEATRNIVLQLEDALNGSQIGSPAMPWRQHRQWYLRPL